MDRPPFSQALRERSREVHRQAERSAFVTALMNGQLDRSGYALLASQHLFIYDALESVAEHLRHTHTAGPFITDRLRRLPSLQADLDVLLGPGWPQRIAPLPATQRYVERIYQTIDWPGGYVAHHYIRYLGDLSGGQAIRAVLARSYGIDGDGASFYRFDQIEKPKRFKDEYRAKLDAAPWELDEQERVVNEVLLGFRLNADVFADLARAVGLEPSQ
ncbi:biliverdin-producing heme oxygenase [Actinobacteria bacterium YIM 96077]|uniref:Biliverdin-producing heme oxygenase n=1 Tax=Phytoactinopolyspora halophila TaxID=1981511 RepID=A0A329QEF0_9ACTN|nr:biliverdin-producing heme oxygenase [Actinobacteria bacterium YIM 96077]RAW10624.1 biliverdin-producing heme oxygenase [Phytoactinopolyspora halophila]